MPGTAVFLTSDPESAPTALLHSLKHYKVLHENNVILTIESRPTPRVKPADRVQHRADSARPSRAWSLRFGFMETPNVPQALALARKRAGASTSCRRRSSCRGVRCDLSPQSGMPLWQDRLFISLARSANDATDYFHIPTGRVVEVGTQVTV